MKDYGALFSEHNLPPIPDKEEISNLRYIARNGDWWCETESGRWWWLNGQSKNRWIHAPLGPP